MEAQSSSFSLHHFSLHKVFPGLPTEAAERSQSCTTLLWSLLSNLAVVASYFKPFSPEKLAGRSCQRWVCLSVFGKREAAQLRQSSPYSTSPEEAQLTGEGNPRRQYGRKNCCWRLRRIHSSCSPWVLGNHNVYSPHHREDTDFFPFRWACGTRSVVFLLPWIFPQVGSPRAHMKAWSD